MITAIVLCHPQSIDLLPEDVFTDDNVHAIRIACGTTKCEKTDFSESNDFFPTYASWNSCLFETSVILTAWEHADQLIGQNDVAIMHTDVKPHLSIAETWEKLNIDVQTGQPVGLTAPSRFNGAWNDWYIPEDAQCRPNQDPFYRHPFDNKIHVWEYIKYYDSDTYDWAISEQPRLIYSHQFACSRTSFDNLGEKLYQVASRLRLRDIGFWTPHMFERLIALYLVRYGKQPLLTTAFWHFASSGIAGPGKQSLYCPQPLRYYKIMPKHCGLKK